MFIFLSPDYFQSSYTLFELVSINERADLDNRFILPLRLTEDMVTYQWTTARDFWQSHEDVRNEMARLLKTGNEQEDHERLWQRIDAAWREIVFSYLDTLSKALEEGQDEPLLENWVAELKRSYIARFKKQMMIYTNM